MNEADILRFIDGFMIDVKQRCYGWMALKSGDKVLDVGCGLGRDVHRLRDFNGKIIDVFGLDLKFMLWRRSWRAIAEQRAAFVAGDALQLPFADNTFDVVWADRLLQHVEFAPNAISECKRILKPDGLVVLADADHSSVKILCEGRPCGEELMVFRASTIKNGSAGKMLESWCGSAGLSIVHSECLNVEVQDLALAERIGLFFGDWDRKVRAKGERQARELSMFLEEIKRANSAGSFRYTSKFYIVSARDRSDR